MERKQHFNAKIWRNERPKWFKQLMNMTPTDYKEMTKK